MSGRSSFLWVSILYASLVIPVTAQDALYQGRIRPGAENSVQSSLTLSFAIDDSKDLPTQQEDALRALYKLAGRSCALVLETIADRCELRNVSTNIRNDEGGQRPNRVTVTAQVMMAVEFKATPGPTTP